MQLSQLFEYIYVLWNQSTSHDYITAIFYVTSMDLYKVIIEMSFDCYFALNKKMLYVGHLIW